MSNWTDEEYARVATALLYPGYQPTFLSVGFTPEEFHMTRLLRVALDQLPDSSKAEVLAYADRVKTLNLGLIEKGDPAQVDGVKKVDRIEFFELAQQRGDVERSVDLARGLLSSVLGVPVNESRLANTRGGGINGTCF